jgi:quercetin dioxygenase-like cupin family protein
MKTGRHSRRHLTRLLPALAFGAAAPAQDAPMPSRFFPFADLPVRESGPSRQRAILQGKTRTGYVIESHMTEVPPGLASHPPHRHLYEEMVMIREGTVEMTIAGKTATLGPGSVVYVASNEEHGLRNSGTTPAHYFIVTFRG